MTDIRARLADAIDSHALANHGIIVPNDLAAHLLSVPGIAIVEVPVVAHKGPNDTDASAFHGAADRLDGGYEPGGSNVKRAISQLLRSVAAAAQAQEEPE